MKGKLISTAGLARAEVTEVLTEAERFSEVLRRPIPVVPALRGRTVALMFFENSTRTRISFELAAKRLSADLLNFSPAGSSLAKGEGLRDTTETIAAMGAACIVVRHGSSGAAEMVANWSGLPVVNAGDGAHEHPTQALVDLFTIRRHRPDIEGLRVTIVGDIAHSRVARSNVWLLSTMGAELTLVAPPTLMPPGADTWPVSLSYEPEPALEKTDVLICLRLQKERGASSRLPSLREYTLRYGIDAKRAALLPEGALILHPGPMNRGVEISQEVASAPNALVGEQVTNGIAVRMAVLYLLLAGEGSGERAAGEGSGERAGGEGSGERDTGGGGEAPGPAEAAGRAEPAGRAEALDG